MGNGHAHMSLGAAVAAGIEMTLSYPALRPRRRRPLDPHIDLARRELWRAFQRGALTEEELATTLERLEFTPPSAS